MKAWYLNHSAVAVQTENHLLLFDLFGQTLRPQPGQGLAQGYIDPAELRGQDVLIFISHEHEDHFEPKVFELAQQGQRVRYILPAELDAIYEGKSDDVFLESGETKDCGDFRVTAFESTDIGLAYLIEIDGKLIYHAGDLNWWHWADETDAFNQDQERRYQEQMKLLNQAANGKEIDIAFAVADPRMDQEHRFQGLRSLMEQVQVKNLIPIHLWGAFSVLGQIRGLARNEKNFEKAVYFERRGEIFLNAGFGKTGGNNHG